MEREGYMIKKSAVCGVETPGSLMIEDEKT